MAVVLNGSKFGLFFDLVNLLFIIFIIIIAERNNIINRVEFYIISFFAATPLLGNDILFNFYIFPDQTKYIVTINLIRDNFLLIINGLLSGTLTEFDNQFNYVHGNRYQPMKYASFVMSAMPIPFNETVRSVGFFSKFIFIVWFLYLIYNQKKYKDHKIYIYFLLLSPSILIYSSLALKEIFILVFFHLSMFFVLLKRPFLFLVSLGILFLLRAELTFLILCFVVSYIFLFLYISEKKINISTQKIIKFIFLVSLFFILSTFYNSLILENYINLVEKINSLKLGYYSEGDLTLNVNYYSTNFLDIGIIFEDFLNALLSPIFSKGDNIFIYLFIIENFALLLIFTWYVVSIFTKNKLKAFFYLGVFFAFNLSVGIIVVNDFAIYRYKITLLIPLVLIMKEEILKYRNENIIFNKS